MWSGERLTRTQLASRPDHLWPELWKSMGKNAKLKEKQKWAEEKIHLDNARKLGGIYFIDPEDKMRKGGATEVQELDEFEVKNGGRWIRNAIDTRQGNLVKMGWNTKGPKQSSNTMSIVCHGSEHGRIEIWHVCGNSTFDIGAQASKRVDDHRCVWHLGGVLPWESAHVVPPKDLRKKEKIWRLLRVSTEFVTRVKCSRRTWRKDSTNTAFREMRWCRVCTGAQCWKHLVCIGETISSSSFQMTGRTISNKWCVKCSRWKSVNSSALVFWHVWNSCTERWDGTLHWKWQTGLASTGGSNSSKRIGKSLWHLDRKRWVKVCVVVLTVWMNKKRNITEPLVGTALHVEQDRPETQYATKEAARFMSGPTRAAKCMLERLWKYYSEAPVLSWSFSYQEMPSEIRAVTDANWAGELEGLCSMSCGWIYFGDHLLETYSSTQLIVALSTAESAYISITKGAAHALEVRSAMVEFGMTFNVV